MHNEDITTREQLFCCIRKELALFEDEYKKQLQIHNILLKPVLDYIIDKKGKRIRPIVFLLSQGLIAKSDLQSISLAVLIEILHTASLIHDDVVDRSEKRRGSDTLNAIWNNKVSVLMGDYLLAKVLEIGVAHPSKRVLELISQVVLKMGEGELYHTLRDVDVSFSVEEYLTVVRNKTAGLFSAACELGGLAGSASPDQIKRLRALGENIGICFQIRDDILDLNGSFGRMGKPAGQDFLNGTVTLPVIYAMEEALARGKALRYSDIRSRYLVGDTWIKDFVERFGGIEKARIQIEAFSDRAIGLLKMFEPSVYRDTFEELILNDFVRPE
jgi:octaprenyl-diphosphate synthase